MFEFHGWLSISSCPGETDTELEDDAKASQNARELVQRLDPPPGIVDLRVVNGQTQLHFGGFTNHRTQDVEDLFALVSEITRNSPGSYGLIYLRDDEDAGGKVNDFRVLVVARGKVTEHQDPFLSPIVPTIEDPCD